MVAETSTRNLAVACVPGILCHDYTGDDDNEEENSTTDGDPHRHATGLLLHDGAVGACPTFGRVPCFCTLCFSLGSSNFPIGPLLRPHVLRHRSVSPRRSLRHSSRAFPRNDIGTPRIIGLTHKQGILIWELRGIHLQHRLRIHYAVSES